MSTQGGIFGLIRTLRTAVAGRRTLLERIARLEIENAVLQQLAMYDHRTGLLNERGFERACNELLRELGVVVDSRKSSYGELVVIGIDINKLKWRNDTYGHDVGNQLIEGVAECLDKGVRSRDVVARLGGDEFVVAMLCAAGEGDEVAQQTLKRLATSCALLSLPGGGASFKSSYTIVPRGELVSLEQVLLNADPKGKRSQRQG